MRKILVLCDNRGYMMTSLLKEAEGKIDVPMLSGQLKKRGYETKVIRIDELQFPSGYDGWYVLYPSSEDTGLFYKGYIEDILLRLELDGAILLPRFVCFRAHHNKVFMELYRSLLQKDFQTLNSKTFYCVADLKNYLEKSNHKQTYPVVIKTSEGAGSTGVALAHNEDELLRKAKQINKISYRKFCNKSFWRLELRPFLGRCKRKLNGIIDLDKTHIRQKFIIQQFVPNLKFDYKVLVFGEKYYLLRRQVRKNDFRASGSGKLEFCKEMTKREYQVMDFARKAYIELDTPMLSIDIAFDGMDCHLIEFQCVNFGPYTMQFSESYFCFQQGKWFEIHAKSVLEEEIANSIDHYILNKQL